MGKSKKPKIAKYLVQVDEREQRIVRVQELREDGALCDVKNWQVIYQNESKVEGNTVVSFQFNAEDQKASDDFGIRPRQIPLHHEDR